MKAPPENERYRELDNSYTIIFNTSFWMAADMRFLILSKSSDQSPDI